MKQVYSARDEMEAHFVKNLLAEQGIEASVQGETLGHARGALPMTTQSLPSVWVDDADAERAEPIVREVRERDKIDDEPTIKGEAWTCPKCGERVEVQFTECWKCGTAKDGAAAQPGE